MTHTTDNEIRVELKYCERCGGLWFRVEYSREVFCASCRQEPLPILRTSADDAPRRPAQSVQSATSSSRWYGPMSHVVERLQGVAETNSPHRPGLTSPSLAACDLRPVTSVRVAGGAA